MSNPWKACNLYQNLLESLPPGLVARVPAGHSRLLAWQRESRHYYQTMYLDEAQGAPALKRPGDAVCRECEKFHLSTLKQIDKNPASTWAMNWRRCSRPTSSKSWIPSFRGS